MSTPYQIRIAAQKIGEKSKNEDTTKLAEMVVKLCYILEDHEKKIKKAHDEARYNKGN